MSGAYDGPQLKARELTPEEMEARQSKCHELDRSIRDGMRIGRETLWQVARDFYEFDAENGWTVMGFESRRAWLASPEIDVSEGTFKRCVRVWGALVAMRGIDPRRLSELDMSKVDIVLPALKLGAPREQVFADVRRCTAAVLREKYGHAGVSERPDLTTGQGGSNVGPPPNVAVDPAKRADVSVSPVNGDEGRVTGGGVLEAALKEADRVLSHAAPPEVLRSALERLTAAVKASS